MRISSSHIPEFPREGPSPIKGYPQEIRDHISELSHALLDASGDGPISDKMIKKIKEKVEQLYKDKSGLREDDQSYLEDIKKSMKDLENLLPGESSYAIIDDMRGSLRHIAFHQ